MRKIKPLLYMGCALLFVSAFISCKTAPATTTTEAAPVQPKVTKPVDADLTALRDKADALRNECLKYSLNTYNPNDWTLAEGARKAGLDAYGTDYDLSKKSFEDAIARYEKIRDASWALLAADLDKSIASAREKAVKAGADSYYPEQFALAGTAADEMRNLRTSGDNASSYDAAQKALLRYQFLLKGTEAVALKKKIEQNQFVQYAPDDFALAGTKYDEASSSYGTSDAAALESMAESVRLYGVVNNAGYKVWTQDMAAKADEVRGLCDSIKAQKTMKDAYGSAAVLYSTAAAAAAANSWEAAYNSYSASSVAFTDVYQTVSLKKNAADAAIAGAKAQQATSSDLAKKADSVAPLPEKAEGYSDEPFVIENNASGEEAK